MKISKEIKISDNGFIFNPQTGDSFNVNKFGIELLQQLEKGIDFEIIKKNTIEKYDVDEITFEKDYYEFYALLKHYQLVNEGDPLDFN